MTDDVTLQTYEACAERYREHARPPSPELTAFLGRLAELVGIDAHLLEIGSGPGKDALRLESRGVRATRWPTPSSCTSRASSSGQRQ